MKLIKSSNGKTKITLSKKEWERIGENAGWKRIASIEDEDSVGSKSDYDLIISELNSHFRIAEALLNLKEKEEIPYGLTDYVTVDYAERPSETRHKLDYQYYFKILSKYDGDLDEFLVKSGLDSNYENLSIVGKYKIIEKYVEVKSKAMEAIESIESM